MSLIMENVSITCLNKSPCNRILNKAYFFIFLSLKVKYKNK